MSSPIPRYAAPERPRQRLRLLAAMGVLVGTAIATGGLARLFSGESEAERAASEVGVELGSGAMPDALAQLEHEVEHAERAAASARAAIRRARLQGTIPPARLDALERRLDSLGAIRASEPLSAESFARGAIESFTRNHKLEPPADERRAEPSSVEPNEDAGEPIDLRRRQGSRTPIESARDL